MTTFNFHSFQKKNTMQYNNFKYLYPPRAEYKIPPSELDNYDNGEYFASPKYNGSACIIATNGTEIEAWNRHKEKWPLLSAYKGIDFKRLQVTGNGKWFVYAGEYLNKGQAGETGEKERNKFVIWDVLVWDGKYLVGETLESRLNLLEATFPCQRSVVTSQGIEMYQHLCCTELKGIYKAPTYMGGFTDLYNELIKVPLYEGIVLKKKDAKLEFGLQELNNNGWQIKCRKPTKIYNF